MWLEDLKPGDKVIVRNRCYPQDRLETIKTKGKQFISLEGWEEITRFRVKDGLSVKGNALNAYELFPATKEALEKLEQKKLKLKLIRKLENVDFSKLPLEVLIQVSEIVEGFNV